MGADPRQQQPLLALHSGFKRTLPTLQCTATVHPALRTCDIALTVFRLLPQSRGGRRTGTPNSSQKRSHCRGLSPVESFAQRSTADSAGRITTAPTENLPILVGLTSSSSSKNNVFIKLFFVGVSVENHICTVRGIGAGLNLTPWSLSSLCFTIYFWGFWTCLREPIFIRQAKCMQL